MDVFDEINILKTKVDSYRPIPTEKMELIDEKFTLDWTYHSNAIKVPIFATERRIYIAAICYIVPRSAQVVGTSSWELDNLINDAIEAEVRELLFRCLTLLESHL